MVYDLRMVAMCVLFHSALGSKVPGNDFIKRLHRFSTANYLNSELKVTKKVKADPRLPWDNFTFSSSVAWKVITIFIWLSTL